ncbi:exosortase A [Rheinheimera sp. WS51]|uniref:exosortase A n=1 Tax=Rheinheimera sp. WS51 TaxID=3425886 RepID=UPI003D8E8BF0
MSHNRYIKALVILIFCISYLVIYGSTWLDMERVWRASATYNHCYLILPISIWFMLKKRNTPHSNTMYSPYFIWLPVLFILLMILVWLLAFAADIALLMHIAAVFSLPALFWLIFGTKAAKTHRFALGYLVFLIPFGEELSLQLQNITADITVLMLQISSIPVFRQGLYLSTPVGMFEVAEACSGLRFLIASLAISTLFAYLNYKSVIKQISFIIFMTVISIIANGFRAFMLVYIGEKSDMQLGFGADHYLYGWLFFGLVLMAGFWLGGRFADDDIQFKHSALKLTAKPIQIPQISTMLLIVTAAVISLNLKIVTPPETPAPALSQSAQLTDANSDWGVLFVDSLAFSHKQDAQHIEYARAVYALKQTQGELFSWQNQLYDKKNWLIVEQHSQANYTLLQLTSLAGDYRSILFWYQVGNQRFTKQLPTKIQQTLDYYFDSDATLTINAISIKGLPPHDALTLLTNVADKFPSMMLKIQSNKEEL